MREEATLRLPVTVDKTHIITLGERLYGESIELVRELVNNAYDADATRVNVQINKDIIVAEDIRKTLAGYSFLAASSGMRQTKEAIAMF